MPLSDLMDLLTPVDVVPAAAGDRTDVILTGATHDSGAVRPGDLFVALPGTRVHGAVHASTAAAEGAVAVLTDPAGRAEAATTGLPVLVVPDPRAACGPAAARIYGAPSESLLVIGVTGTNGKTTTSYLVESGLRAAGHRTGLVGTVQTRIADDVLDSVRTTPEATDLQALFAVMRERGVDAVAMEVSSHALALGRMLGTAVDVAVFTNLSQDHLDFHRDLEDYFAAKSTLFTPTYSAHGVVNVDDEHGALLAERADIPVTTFSPSGLRFADWRRTGPARCDRGGGTATVAAAGAGTVELQTRLLTAVNLDNAIAAFVSLVAAGVPVQAARDGVAAQPGVPGRLERVDVGQPFLALVDYAHTPAAVHAVLTALRPLTPGRLVIVLGCGGDRDRAKRPMMGAAAARGADLAVLTSDNPRSEPPADILAAMRAGVDGVASSERGEVVVEPDRQAAIDVAVRYCRSGDTLLVAGKGHEQGQELADRVVPFDDRTVLRAALTAAGVGG